MTDDAPDGANIFLVKQIKGNQCVVTVGKVPGTLSELAVESGTTIEAVLELADLDAEGFEIKMNGSTVSEDTAVVDGANIFLVKQIKGNN